MNELHTNEGASVTELVSGIVKDAQDLAKQQLALFRHELQESARSTMQAGAFLAVGAGIAFVGGFLLCLMLVHLVSWAAPSLPLWACYSIVGAPIAALGGALVFAGMGRLKSINLLPEQSAQALKENVRWITNPR